MNLEQQLTADLGMFVRVGWSQGGVEEVDFTDINQSASIGFAWAGPRWGRPDDIVGVAVVANQISRQAKAYLAAGGLGGIIGDGQLPHAGPEQILETYYSLAAFGFAHVTVDYQFINNPAYNPAVLNAIESRSRMAYRAGGGPQVAGRARQGESNKQQCVDFRGLTLNR